MLTAWHSSGHGHSSWHELSPTGSESPGFSVKVGRAGQAGLAGLRGLQYWALQWHRVQQGVLRASGVCPVPGCLAVWTESELE